MTIFQVYVLVFVKINKYDFILHIYHHNLLSDWVVGKESLKALSPNNTVDFVIVFIAIIFNN